MSAENPNNTSNNVLKRPRKSRRGTSLKNVRIDRLNKKLMNILDREVNKLLKLSALSGLEKDDANNLINYLKLVKNLMKETSELEDNLTIEELEKIAAKA